MDFIFPLRRLWKAQIALFSDGACRGNPGPGSWAFVAQSKSGEVIQKATGVAEHTTNNRMELQGAIERLAYLDTVARELHKSAFFTPILAMWWTAYLLGSKAGRPEAGKRPIKKRLKMSSSGSSWTNSPSSEMFNLFGSKADAGHPQNELCDQLANGGLDAQGY